MEWLKKHWEILAAVAVGIPLLYWLYQTYQTDQANAAQAAQSTDLQNQEQADEAAYAQQIALGNVGGVGGGYGGGSSGPIQQSTQAPVTGTNTAPLPTPINTDPTGPTNTATGLAAPPGEGYADPSTVVNAAPPTLAGYTFNGIALVANTPDTTPAPSNPTPVSSAVSALLGSGGGSNDTGQVPIYAVPTTPSIPLTHISNGTIPAHDTAIAQSPTPVEMSSLSGRI
jgi:hypothetical protein